MKTVAFDLETTGVPAYGADYEKHFMDFPYIVTLAYKINAEPVKEFIINQEGRKIPPEATAIHGITDEMCDASPYLLRDVLSGMVGEAEGNDFSIGHNIYFDSSIVKANVLRLIEVERSRKTDMNFEALAKDFYGRLEHILRKECRIDTMKASTNFCAIPGSRGYKWPKLIELHEKLFPGETFDAHSAGADVDACYRCYIKLKELGVI